MKKNPFASRMPLVLAIVGIVAVVAVAWFFFTGDDEEPVSAGRVVRIEATDAACWSVVLPEGQADQPPEQQSCGNAELRLTAAGPVSVTKTGPEGTLTVVGLVDDDEVSRHTISDPFGSVTVDPQAAG